VDDGGNSVVLEDASSDKGSLHSSGRDSSILSPNITSLKFVLISLLIIQK